MVWHAGVWYLVGLGGTALLFSLYLPRGLWGWIEDRTGCRLLFGGYRVRLPGTTRPAPELAARNIPVS